MRGMLMVLMVLASPMAWAEWQPIPAADSDALKVYIDPASVQWSGNMVGVRILRNYTKTWIHGERSSTGRHEFDCSAKKHRVHQLTLYSGELTTGGVIHTIEFGKGEWDAIVPGAVEDAVLKNVCRK